MRLVGLMAARNEDWTIGLTLRAALMWCDVVVVGIHACTDRTGEILNDIVHECDRDEHFGRVVWIDQPNEVWAEMSHRQRMLDSARELRTVGGESPTHIAYIDADEILTGNLLPYIRQHVERLAPGHMMSLPWLQLRDNVGYVMSTGMWAEQNASVAFKDIPQAHWAARDGYDFHQRKPLGVSWQDVEPMGRRRRGAGLLHLQFLSAKRLKAKQYLYCLTERLRWPNRQMPDYPRTVRESQNARVSPVPVDWWAPYEHIAHHLHIDAEPWQLAEVQRILRERPGIEVGLDDFGLGAMIAANAPIPA